MRSLSGVLACSGFGTAAWRRVPDKFFFEEGKIRVLILTGRNNHEWRTTTPFLRTVLEASGRFDVTRDGRAVRTHRRDTAAIRCAGVQLLRPALGQAGREGRGGVCARRQRPGGGACRQLSVRRDRRSERAHGPHGRLAGATGPRGATWWARSGPTRIRRPATAKRHAYEVKWRDPQHPITAGLKPFTVSDELYHNFRLKPGIHILASALDSPAIGGTGKTSRCCGSSPMGRAGSFTRL